MDSSSHPIFQDFYLRVGFASFPHLSYHVIILTTKSTKIFIQVVKKCAIPGIKTFFGVYSIQ